MPTRRWALLGAALIGVAACGDPPPGDTYFEHFIQPVLVQNCNTVSGCHQVNTDPMIADFGRAAGNLDVMTFENISKRRDLLQTYGAYKYPGLLIKATSPTNIPLLGDTDLTIEYGGVSLPLEVAHSGMGVLDPDSDAFQTLLEWIQNGATENGLKPPTPPQDGEGPCSTVVPSDFTPADIAAAQAEPTFGEFQSNVQPVLERHNCAAGNCHGAPQADFYVTCGTDNNQLAFNFAQTRGFVSAMTEQSQILNVPLARAAGGLGHSGGDQFSDRDDPDYVAMRTWAMNAGPSTDFGDTAGELFFAEHVQPIFLQRGCAFMNCHSPAATNDFKLRSGSQGFFSTLALQKNYDLFKKEFMAVEFPDARQGRAVSKNLLPIAGGIRHRGGPVLETPGRNVDQMPCPGVFDPNNKFSPYCTIQEWVNLERTALGGQVSNYANPQIVYVDRPGGGPGDTVTEFNTYRPGSELMLATFNTDAQGHLVAGPTANVSLTGGGACGGATPAASDIRGPDVNIDGDWVAFGMRTGAGTGLQIWKYQISTGTCTQLTTTTSGNGITIDNFDPTWAPDGQSIVFASSRGGAEGPTHTRSPGFQPQADIWRMRADGTGLEQMTFLSNSEIGPALMREGRITMTTEKVYFDPEANQGSGVVHQLSGRRINWDITDYHPLLAQRAVSPYADPDDITQTRPSVDFAQATDIRERSNGDFLLILSDVGANGGGGALAIFNRSAGTFETGRRAIDPGYLESVTMVAQAGDTGMGRLAATTAYRGTFGLHDGQILSSYATLGGTLDTANNIPWKLVSVHVDTYTGVATHTQLIAAGGAQMDAVEVVKKPPGLFFVNKRQLVFGGVTDLSHAATAYLHLPDAPMVFTLLTGNLRRGRPVETFRAATRVEFFREGRNTAGVANMMGIYQDRPGLGGVDLMADGSTRAAVPTGTGVVMKLVGDGGVVVSMGEEHQFGPGEEISLGIQESLFDAACGSCHGSVSQSELDIATTPDVLTGASKSMAQTMTPLVPQ